MSAIVPFQRDVSSTGDSDGVRIAELRSALDTESSRDRLLALGELAELLRANGDFDGAIDAARDAIAASSGDGRREAANTVRLATALQYAGRHAEALGVFDRARANDTPGFVEYRHFVLQHMGKCLVEMGRVADACAAFDDALALRIELGHDDYVASTLRARATLRRVRGSRPESIRAMDAHAEFERRVATQAGRPRPSEMQPRPIDARVVIGHAHLKTADIQPVYDFYVGVLGFEVMERRPDSLFVAAGDYHHHLGFNTWQSKDGEAPASEMTGLYHFAIRYPDRATFIDAVRRITDAEWPIDSTMDHGTHESIYVSDPDSNGVELCWDRPSSEWPLDADGHLAFNNAALDVEALLSTSDALSAQTARPGVRPTTSQSGPHRQLDQIASPQIWGLLASRLFSIPGVAEGHSVPSLATSRALMLEPADANGPNEAFLGGTEFAHLHDVFDTSLHLCLPLERAREVCELGWGEPHGYAEQGTEVMIYAPRDEAEIDIVLAIVGESLVFARGSSGVSSAQ